MSEDDDQFIQYAIPDGLVCARSARVLVHGDVYRVQSIETCEGVTTVALDYERGISREEFNVWLAKFRRLAPNHIGNVAHANEYFESIQRVPVPSLRRALQRKLDLETRGSSAFNERAARDPKHDYGLTRAEFDEWTELMYEKGRREREGEHEEERMQKLFEYLRRLPVDQARKNLETRCR